MRLICILDREDRCVVLDVVWTEENGGLMIGDGDGKRWMSG